MTEHFTDGEHERAKRVLTSWPSRFVFKTVMHIALRKVDTEKQTGLLAGTILAPELLYPADTKEQLLGKRIAAPGRWIGYDFMRQKTFGDVVRERNSDLEEGRLTRFLPDGLVGADSRDLTPTGTFDIRDIQHVLTLSFPSIAEATEEGLIEHSTYEAAYTPHAPEYLPEIGRVGLLAAQVYVVTPKGNGLLFLLPEAGSPGKSPRLPEFARSPALQPVLA